MADPSSHTPSAAHIVTALDHLGVDLLKRRGSALTIKLAEGKLVADSETLAAQLSWLPESPTPESVAIALASILNIRVPPLLLSKVKPIAPLFRPMLVRPEELQGPQRSMCRRDAFGPLVLSVAVGVRSNAPRVQTAHLDGWGVEFDDIVRTATENLRLAISPEHVLGVEETPGLIAIMHDEEPVAASCYLLEELIDGVDSDAGVLFGVPTSNSLIAMPITPGGGADGLAALVEMMFSLTEHQTSPLSDQVFWAVDGDYRHIPMVEVEEEGARRIHLDARGTVAELLQVLGEIDEGEDNDNEDDTAGGSAT